MLPAAAEVTRSRIDRRLRSLAKGPRRLGNSGKLSEALRDRIRMRYLRFCALAHERNNGCGEGFPKRISRVAGAWTPSDVTSGLTAAPRRVPDAFRHIRRRWTVQARVRLPPRSCRAWRRPGMTVGSMAELFILLPWRQPGSASRRGGCFTDGKAATAAFPLSGPRPDNRVSRPDRGRCVR